MVVKARHSIFCDTPLQMMERNMQARMVRSTDDALFGAE